VYFLATFLLAQALPPLSFSGFRPGMPTRDAAALITGSKGTVSCRGSSDPRLRECTGSFPIAGIAAPLAVLISSVNDSAAVIVLSGRPPSEEARAWVEDLTIDYGRPNHRVSAESQHTWQWIRRGRMIRVVARLVGDTLEASVTLTHGPLLDGLGPPEIRKPD
jgi:hypothetical protein